MKIERTKSSSFDKIADLIREYKDHLILEIGNVGYEVIFELIVNAGAHCNYTDIVTDEEADAIFAEWLNGNRKLDMEGCMNMIQFVYCACEEYIKKKQKELLNMLYEHKVITNEIKRRAMKVVKGLDFYDSE